MNEGNPDLLHSEIRAQAPVPGGAVAPIPGNEAERLSELERLLILDSPAESDYDDLVALASEVCGTPIALVSLVDHDRQWFKARVGLDATETPRELAFCAHAIGEPDHVFVVNDAAADARFADNALVTGGPKIRFYAGAPIVTDEGLALGTVCVVDTKPRELSASQARCLRALARQAAGMLEMRKRSVEAARIALEQAGMSLEARLKQQKGAELLDLVLQGRELGLWDLDVPSGRWSASDHELRMLGYCAAEPAPQDWLELVHPDDRALTKTSLAPHLRGETPYYECTVRLRHRDGHWVWMLSRGVVVLRDDAGLPVRIVGTHMDVTEAKRDRLALEEARNLLEQTAALARVGGWKVDLVDRTVSWSREVYRIHEVGPDWVPDVASGIAFYAPEARPVIAGAVEAAIADGTTWDLELPFVTAKGTRLWVRTQGHAEYEGGRAVRLVGVFQDITERKRAENARIEGEHRLRMITDNMPALIMHIDSEERYAFVNAHFQRVFGYEGDKVLGRTLREVCGEAIYADIAPHVAKALRGEPTAFEATGLARGEMLQSHYVPDVDVDGRVVGFYALIFDVTARKRAELKSVESETMLRGITDNLPACIAAVDRDGRFRFANETYRTWLGIDPHAVIGKSVDDAVGAEYMESRREHIARALAGEAVTFEQKVGLRIGERTLHSTYLPHFDANHRVAGFYALTNDITEHKETQRRLDALARIDALTGLPNRRHFEERVLESKARARRTGQRSALFYLDVDRFKSINDTLGHAIGDELLQQFAARLRDALRETDFVARHAGDEFIAIAEGVADDVEARALAEKIAAAIRVPFSLSTVCLNVTASVGIATFDGVESLRSLLARADSALYVAKGAGRNCIRVGPAFDPEPGPADDAQARSY